MQSMYSMKKMNEGSQIGYTQEQLKTICFKLQENEVIGSLARFVEFCIQYFNYDFLPDMICLYLLVVLFSVLLVFGGLLFGLGVTGDLVRVCFESGNETPEQVVQAGGLADATQQPVQGLHRERPAGGFSQGQGH